MEKLFINIYDFFSKHSVLRYLLMILFIVIFVLCASKIKFEEDIAGFLPKTSENEKINYILENTGVNDKIILKLHNTDTTAETDIDELNTISERFVTILDSIVGNKYISNVFYKVDQSSVIEISSFITKNIPYFLEDDDYSRLDSMLVADSIRKILENDRNILVSPAGMALKKNIMLDPLQISFPILKHLQTFNISDEYTTYNDYIFSKDGKNQIILLTSTLPVSETAQNKLMIEGLDKSISQTCKEYGNKVSMSYFGAAAIAVTNANQIKKDTYMSLILASVLMIAVMLYFFRRFDSILLLFVPILFGVLFALAVLALTKGTISAIAIGAGSIILGVALNYSLHYMVHCKYVPDAKSVLKDISFPLTIGSITTIGAFLSLLFIRSGSMRDFGLFAALTLIGTTLFVLIFLPFIVGKKSYEYSYSQTLFERSSSFNFHGNIFLLITVVCLTVFFAFYSKKTSFEGNMNSINYMTSEQRATFKEMSKISNLSKALVYNVSEGSCIDSALMTYEESSYVVDSLLKSGDIDNYSSIGYFLPSSEMQKIKLLKWNNFWASRRDKTLAMIKTQSLTAGFKPGAFSDFTDILDKKYEVVGTEYFQVLIDHFLNNYLIVKDNHAIVMSLIYTKPDNLSKIENMLPGMSFDSGTVMRKTIDYLSDDFNFIVYVCGILVFVFLLISFGRLELSLIAFLPMFISWIWILGIMAFFNIKFNIVNIILATFIFGLGDDYSIFIMEGLIQEYTYKRKLVNTFKSAVIMSAVTMFIGIGTLIIAKHPAMRSLGEVTIVGMFSVVIMSFIIPPVLFDWLTKKHGQIRKYPVTLENFLMTCFCFIVFLIGSIILTLCGFFILTVGGKSDKHKLLYHKILCANSKFIYHILPAYKKSLVNEYGEKFDKPGIIICNHQSHLDLLIIMMLSPKLIILTNDWVWKSPFYGLLIRYADYYTVANGLDVNMNNIEKAYKSGYSIVVFPEGTRSEDCSILRFHKGAFYLAEKLHADIIPIMIHGFGHVLPKSEFIFRRGYMNVKIMKRIPAGNFECGIDYLTISKNIRCLYISEYDEFAKEIETPQYFRDLVRLNYAYKGVYIERNVRQLLKDNDNYSEKITNYPDNGTVIVDNCGYGVFSLILALVKKDLIVIATDSDSNKIGIASNCQSIPKNLIYKLKTE